MGGGGGIEVAGHIPGHVNPLLPGLDDDGNFPLLDFTRRFWWTLPLIAALVSEPGFTDNPIFVRLL